MLKTISWGDFIKIMSPQYYVLLVTSDGKRTNLTGISWFSIVSWEPPMAIVSIRDTRFGYKLLQKNHEFVICIPSEEQQEAAIMCGKMSGSKVDKVKQGNFRLLQATKIRVPLIDKSTACIECQVNMEIPAGDHRIILADIVECHGDFDKIRHIYTTAYSTFYALDFSGVPEKG